MQRQTWRRSALLAVGALCMVASGVQTAHAEAPEVFSTWRNVSSAFQHPSTVLRLDVPLGHYMVVAKLFAHSDSQTELTCTLKAGDDFDISVVALDPSKRQLVVNTLVHSFYSDGYGFGQIFLECQAPGPDPNLGTARLEFVKVTATKVNAVQNRPFEY